MCPSCVSDAPLRIKLELHLRDIQRFDEPQTVAFAVGNTWFSGSANVRAFSLEETLATKMQALMGRHKGRDLFDLDWALLFCPHLDKTKTLELFELHCNEAGNPISRPEAEKRMFAKIEQPGRFDEIINYVPAEQRRLLMDQGAKDAFARVFTGLIERLPGNQWGAQP